MRYFAASFSFYLASASDKGQIIISPCSGWADWSCGTLTTKVSTDGSAARWHTTRARKETKISQSQKRPILGPSPGWKHLTQSRDQDTFKTLCTLNMFWLALIFKASHRLRSLCWCPNFTSNYYVQAPITYFIGNKTRRKSKVQK